MWDHEFDSVGVDAYHIYIYKITHIIIIIRGTMKYQTPTRGCLKIHFANSNRAHSSTILWIRPQGNSPNKAFWFEGHLLGSKGNNMAGFLFLTIQWDYEMWKVTIWLHHMKLSRWFSTTKKRTLVASPYMVLGCLRNIPMSPFGTQTLLVKSHLS